MIDLWHGDCCNLLPALAEESVDAAITDPPYGLEFMGKEWDRLWAMRDKSQDLTGKSSSPFLAARVNKHVAGSRAQQWHHQWAAAVLRVLKPSGYLLAFGGTRTFHRLACALEDAGFEMRDTLMWVYGSGFPKGRGCLKPAWEPILLCRKPGAKVKPLQIDACRVPCEGGSPAAARREASRRTGHVSCKPGCCDRPLQDRSSPEAYLREREGEAAGRWPANVVHDGSAEVLEAFAAFGESTSPDQPIEGIQKRRHDVGSPGKGVLRETPGVGYGDTGTAARFFYTAKASRRERNEGLEGMPLQDLQHYGDDITPRRNGASRGGALTNGTGKVTPQRNSHPTVKPLALVEWLVKLACPPVGMVLDPFLGSGTTAVACWRTDRQCIGIERDETYFRIAQKRLAAARQKLGLFAEIE